MKKRLITGHPVFNNLLVLFFPLVPLFFLCFLSSQTDSVRKNAFSYGLLALAYCLYLLLCALFAYHFIGKRARVSWPALGVGAAAVLLFHFRSFWRLFPLSLCEAVLSAFPYHYLMLGMPAALYLVLLFMKITQDAR